MKSEDPAKMTYSIPDFLSRGREERTGGVQLEMVSGNLTQNQRKSVSGLRGKRVLRAQCVCKPGMARVLKTSCLSSSSRMPVDTVPLGSEDIE